MSCLRPSCSDAAARVTNLSVSRFVPTFRQVDAQTEVLTTSTPNAVLLEPARTHRLPSQRPLDRRWDESRGLIFSQRSNAPKNHTWTPRRGIAFARFVEQRRGYAQRKLNAGLGPPPPTPRSSAEQSGRVFGRPMSDLEPPDEPIDVPATATKGSKQERFEREIKERDVNIEELRGELAERNSELQNLQQRVMDVRKEKDREINETLKSLQELEEEKQSAIKRLEKANAEYEKVRKERDAIQKKYSTQREDLAKEIADRERSLAVKKTEFDHRMSERTRETDQKFAKANQYDATVKQNAKVVMEELEARSKELNVKEEGMRTRKVKRPDYNAYRHHYTPVHDEENALEDKLGLIRKRLDREKEELKTMALEVGGAGWNAATSDEAQKESASARSQALAELIQQVEGARKDLVNIDTSLRREAHVSRMSTKTVRFDDVSLKANSVSKVLYSTSITPLRSVKTRVLADIKDVDKQIDDATNTTLREELGYQKDALYAELAALQGAVDLAFLDQSIQVLEILKLEPYSHKAVHMRTIDIRTDLDQKSQAMHEKGDKTSNQKLGAERDALQRQANLEKQRALVLEINGQHVEDERKLDEMIDQRIAFLVEKSQAKRSKMAGDQRAARAAAKRAHPVHAPPARASAAHAHAAPASRTVARKARVRSDTNAWGPKYLKLCTAKQHLRTLLLKSGTSLNAAERAEKVHRYNLLSVEVTDVHMRLIKAQLIADPKTDSDFASNEKRARSILECAIARAKAKMRLEKNLDLDAKLTPEQELEAERLIEIETGLARTEQKELAELRKQLSELPAPNSQQAIKSRQELKRQIAAAQVKVKDQNLQVHPELRAKSPKNAQASEASLMETPSNQEIKERADVKTRFKGRTRLIRRVTRSSPYGRLGLTPSYPAQAAHTSPARRELHDNLLWPPSKREHLPLEDPVQPRQTGPGSAHSPFPVDNQEGNLRVSALGNHPMGAATSDELLRSEGSSAMEAARDDDNAKSHGQATSASLCSESPIQTTSSHNNINHEQKSSNKMAEPEEEALQYEIPVQDKRNALIASRNSTASFWRYSLYKNAAGQAPTRHYCTTFEQTEAQIANFLGEKVVGFDLEWEKRKSKPGEDSNKRCVSLMQVAAEGKVALFHLALFKGGDSAGELLPPALRGFLENPEIIKTGVNIGGDATRLRNCFGVEMRGNIELSHLYKVVMYGETQPEKVNRGLYALANQVKEVLHLPLGKGDVRTSSWSKRLNVQQIDYAVSDAYAGLRLFHELERKRKAMNSKPPRPAFHELALPLMLGGSKIAPSALRRAKEPAAAPEVEEAEPAEESAALQDDGAASEESNENFFDTAEDLEAFDAYVESQDAADAATGASSLPEITYPTLLPLEPAFNFSSRPSSSSSSDLPSDPLAPSLPSAFPSTQAATADAWVTTWQDQLPAAYNLRVSRPHLRAYHLWHHQGYSLQEVAALLRKEPLALSTVVSYVAEVLQKEGLEFDEERVREIRARLPSSIRGRYGRLYARNGDAE